MCLLILARPLAAQTPDAPLDGTMPEVSAASTTDFGALVASLKETDFPDRERIVLALAATQHASARSVLAAFLDNRLHIRLGDGRVFVTAPADESAATLDLLDPVSLAAVGTAPREELERIGTNNRLRRVLRGTVARFDLASPDTAVRLAAVKEMLRDPDEATTALLGERFEVETDKAVRREVETGLALAALDGSDRARRLSAVQVLSGRLGTDVVNRLTTLVTANDDGTFVENDEEVREAAQAALARIERSRSMYSGIQTLFFGLSLGSVLVLVAIGLAITFGVMGVINMAHGELMMIGAYTTYVVQTLMPAHIDWSLAVAIPAAFVVSGGTGILIEQTVIKYLYGRPLETLLATFGVSLVLQQTVRSMFTALNRSVETPSWMSGTWEINEALGITYNRLYIVLFTVVVFALLLLVLRRTRLGLSIRAVSQNRAMARAMGIRSGWVDAMTFGLGSGIAGIAGVALSQLTNVGPNLGQSYIIDSFMVVVFGGVGNLWGALIGGVTMGVVNNLLEPYAGAVLAKILVLIALILFIQRRPRGLFPPAGRAAEQA